jgi:hypothetical protein
VNIVNKSKIKKLEDKHTELKWIDLEKIIKTLFRLLRKAEQPITINGGSYSYSSDMRKNPLIWYSSDGGKIKLQYFSDILDYLSDYIVGDILEFAADDELSRYIKPGKKTPNQEEHEEELLGLKKEIREIVSGLS